LQKLRLLIQEDRANLDVGNPLGVELVKALAQHKVFVDPTLVVFRNQFLLIDQPEIFDSPDHRHVTERLRRWWSDYRARRSPPPETLDLRKRELKNYLTLTGMMYRAGVRLLVGTDSPEPFTPPGLALHQEMALFVEAGLPPAAVLQAATLHTAQVLKMDSQLGSIEEGKLADLVILDANPLEDISNTRKISQVVKNGVVLDPKEILRQAAK
jgi:imidazolonepropionase-like amidohydrolase